MLEDLVDHLVLAAQLLQDRCIGRPPGPRPLRGGQLQLVEEDRFELLGRPDVELVAHRAVDLRLERCELRAELLAHRGERPAVDEHPGELHAREDRDEWHLDLGEEIAQRRLGQLTLQRPAREDRGERLGRGATGR